MDKKTFCFALVAFIIFNAVDARRTRRTKRPKSDEDSTPQPNAVTYSTFGFNDVGGYDGFVPSSPDYANYLSKYNQESSTTRLYAPAFPTGLESAGYINYPQSQDGTQPSGTGTENEPQASMLQYPQSTMSFYNTPSFDSSENQGKNEASGDIYGRSSPIYGAKISSRNKNRGMSHFNNTDFNAYSSVSSSGSQSPTDVKYSTFHEVQSSYESKPTSFGEPNKNYQSHYNFAPTYSTTDNEELMKPTATTTQSTLKFQKVLDFTKYKQYYPTDLDNKYPTVTTKPSSYNNPSQNVKNENTYFNNFEDHNKKFLNPASAFNDALKDKDVEDVTEKQLPKPTTYTDLDYSQNYFSNSKNKDIIKDTKLNFDFKDKFKYKPWTSANYTNDFKNWKNPFKGYQYSNDYSNTTFEFDFSGAKKPENNQNDELVPASSNVFDLSSYQSPETDYSKYKKIPGFKSAYAENFANNVYQSLKNQEKYDPEDYVRSLYSTVPTTTSHWGNVYKPHEYSFFKQHPKKPFLFTDIDMSDDIVHIPKKHYGNKYNYGKYSESKPIEWSSFTSHRPYKPKKNKEVTRYKSEEDLLGLRTHDTSHASYIPTYRPSNAISEDFDYKDYKKLVEKWRQSYLKAKFKDSSIQDFEGYSSETKPVHVPIPKPYPIEIPHPVIVPVPQPYPVRVPVPKPVAVPVIQELTVPVERPMPYAVIKKVPYPVEKHVPVPVEKEVAVPVVKPYPVPIPHIRPVFHHSRPNDEEIEIEMEVEAEEEYRSRPPSSSKRIPYAKRPRDSRKRYRRPSRTTYQDRNRRRWPSNRPGSHPEQRSRNTRRPSPSTIEFQYPRPFKHHEVEVEEPEHESTDLYLVLKKNV